MNLLDVIIVLLLVFSFIKGLFKGFVLELSGLIGIIISIYIARCYSAPAIQLAESFFKVSHEISPAVGFLITFLISLLLFHLLALLIDRFVRLIALGWLNRGLGGVLSLFKYLLVISVFINVFDLVNHHFDLTKGKSTTKSRLYTPVQKIVPTVLPFLHLDEPLEYFQKEKPQPITI